MKKVIAFDCGGTNTRLALINEKFKIEKTLVRPTIIDDKEGWINCIIEMIQQFSLENVVAISLGVPGVCLRDIGVIHDMSNIHIYDVHIKEILEEKFNIPVFIRNDAEVACLGEAHLGAGKNYKRVFFVTISTGLGGALCVDGYNQDYITELGHTAYVYKNHVSEYEKLVSGLNIKNLAQINNVPHIDCAKQLFDGKRKNDPDCTMLFEEWFFVLSEFIKLINDSYRPDIICVTGGLAKSADLFLKRLAKENKESKIVKCKFSEDAGLIGASVYGFQCINK